MQRGASHPMGIAGMTAESLARTIQARRHGDYWMARCVAHDDRNPSLKIAESNGRLLLKCFAGCSWAQITQELRARGMWSDEPTRQHSPNWGTIVQTYDYTDE